MGVSWTRWSAGALPWLGVAAWGCTALLGIDEDYRRADDPTTSSTGTGAGTATGSGSTGSGGSGGTVASGGGGGAPLAPNGEPCTGTTECASGHCVDDVCCDAECTGDCRSCLATYTDGSDGTCAAVIAYEDPDGDCPEGEQACDGAGACRRLDGQSCQNGNQCISGNCQDDKCEP